MRTIQELIRDSHDRAGRKGWWEDCRDRSNPEDGLYLDPAKVRALIPEKLALIHSEISEALECYRRGEMKPRFVGGNEKHQAPHWEDRPCSCGTPHKPEGFPSELADVVIRCCDLAGALGIRSLSHGNDWKRGLSLPAALNRLHDGLYCFVASDVDAALSEVVEGCFDLAAEHGIDLWVAINAKAAYNETRPYRHGKRC